jgi:thiamine-monophosphate kinase
MREGEIIERLLRPIATHPAARGLADDAAVWSPPMGRELVLTHDVIAEGVHYLGTDDPSDIAWKLVAVNLSDLAAKGAEPAGVLIGLGELGTALFGGDTTTGAASAVLGCTAIGHVPRGQSLSRMGAKPGDDLYVTGTIGDAGLGLAIARGEAPADPALLRRYRLPVPRLAMGQGLAAAGAHAAMDVSDGLLIDASRMAKASGVRIEITLADVPLSDAAAARLAPGDTGRLAAATAGDDYELLIAAPPESRAALLTLSEATRLRLTRVGRVEAGEGFLVIGEGGAPVSVPRLGYEHGA